MQKIALLLLLVLGVGGAQAQTPEEDLKAFIDDFFTEFAGLTERIRSGDNAAGMEMIRLTRQNFVAPKRGAVRPSDKVPEADMMATLWPHGPKSWTVENVRVAGDVARADVTFMSVLAHQKDPIPYSMRFIRESDRWRILRAEDLRPEPEQKMPDEVTLPAEREVAVKATPEATLDEYLRYLYDNKGPIDVKNPAKLYPAAKKIGDEIAALWGKDPAARRARNEATAKILLMDLQAWEVVEAGADGGIWTATVAITLGERNPMAAFIKTPPRVKLSATEQDGGWKLMGYEQLR